ncbi:DUF4224 domain-containing protein [Dyella sp. 20L07]|uniref:DUF4224 domain-containing protein n=1 Tax=Dyella sp. 20L07 TaxID=3384240 RepID=UPI003D29402A
MRLCLTRDELAELTRARTKARQVTFLRKNGIRHYVDDHGWPVVTRAAVEGMPEQAQPKPTWAPNMAA